MTNVKPYILAIDSSTSVLRVGLSLNDGKIASQENKDRYQHAEFIYKLIEDVLVQSRIEKSVLHAIVVSTGPGSFTGLRVGMASAKALAVSLNIPLVGVSTYSAIATRLFTQFGKTCVLIPSRKNEFYLGRINSGKYANEKTILIRIENLRDYAGDVNLLGVDLDIDSDDFPDFRIIKPEEFVISIEDYIFSGQERLAVTGGDDISRLEPLYIQEFPARSTK